MLRTLLNCGESSLAKPVSEAQISGMFDRIASKYDFLNRLLSARQDQRWRQVLVQHVPYRPEGKFLDVATGTGDVLLAAARKHREYREFIGVDISGEMLKLADLKFDKAGFKENSRFQMMSAERLDFEDSSMDCLSISFGLRNVVDKKKALQEFHRVLKKDGTLLILEFFTPQSGPLAWLFNFYFKRILPTIGGLISDKSAYTYLPSSVGQFYSLPELRQIIYDTGYCIDAQKDFLFGGCRLIRARKIS